MQATKKKTTFIEFVDDVNVLTYNINIEENCKILKKIARSFYDVISTS